MRSGTGGGIVLGVREKPAGSAAARYAVEGALLRGLALEAVRAWHGPVPVSTGSLLVIGEPGRFQERRAIEAVEEAPREAPAWLRTRPRTVEGPAREALPASTTPPARWPSYRSPPEPAQGVVVGSPPRLGRVAPYAGPSVGPMVRGGAMWPN